MISCSMMDRMGERRGGVLLTWVRSDNFRRCCFVPNANKKKFSFRWIEIRKFQTNENLFCSSTSRNRISVKVVVKQRLERRVEDREVPGSSPTQDKLFNHVHITS